MVVFLWKTNNLHGLTFLLTCLKLGQLESSKYKTNGHESTPCSTSSSAIPEHSVYPAFLAVGCSDEDMIVGTLQVLISLLSACVGNEADSLRTD